MNLLTDDWIPVRPQLSGAARQISLQTLLCGNDHWELALPRDDMELAALQLLICLTQVLMPPKDKKQWAERISKPVTQQELATATQGYQDWFQVDHPEYPFMQVKGVTAQKTTPMDKLFTGLDTSTNSRFINEKELASQLCGGCASIALFNLGSNSPAFGGGFKYPLRVFKSTNSPVTTFAQGQDLRTTIWLNVLSVESLDEYLPDWKVNEHQPPTWVEPIKEKSTIFAHDIGLLKGLFWQPSHTELVKQEKSGQCSCCGHKAEKLFTEFNKAKFNYTIDGIWVHPHSPQVLSVRKGKAESRFVAFTQSIPAWTQLSRYVVKRDISEVNKGEQGQNPALVVQQVNRHLPKHANKFELLIGGYRNNQAAIIERRHEVLTLNHGWESHADTVHELVAHGLKYKTALRKVLYICSKGITEKERKLKGTGLDLHEVGETRFYRRTEDAMTHALADVDFDNPMPTFMSLDHEFKQICEAVFSELTSPYEHDPELFRTLAIAHRSLQRHIKEIRIQQNDEDAA